MCTTSRRERRIRQTKHERRTRETTQPTTAATATAAAPAAQYTSDVFDDAEHMYAYRYRCTSDRRTSINTTWTFVSVVRGVRVSVCLFDKYSTNTCRGLAVALHSYEQDKKEKSLKRSLLTVGDALALKALMLRSEISIVGKTIAKYRFICRSFMLELNRFVFIGHWFYLQLSWPSLITISAPHACKQTVSTRQGQSTYHESKC